MDECPHAKRKGRAEVSLRRPDKRNRSTHRTNLRRRRRPLCAADTMCDVRRTSSVIRNSTQSFNRLGTMLSSDALLAGGGNATLLVRTPALQPMLPPRPRSGSGNCGLRLLISATPRRPPRTYPICCSHLRMHPPSLHPLSATHDVWIAPAEIQLSCHGDASGTRMRSVEWSEEAIIRDATQSGNREAYLAVDEMSMEIRG